MIERDELIFRIAFASYRNINIETASNFAARGVSVRDFFELPAQRLAAITGIRSDYFSDEKRSAALELARREADFIAGSRVKPVFYTDPGYPARMAECGDAPAMLYVAGNDEAARASYSVAIVGTRHCTPYGADFTRRLVSELASTLDGSLLIVSGLAFGVDIAAHRAALESGVPTAAVLAHGLNTIYPADHRNEAKRIISDGGFLATEYRSSDRIHRGNFLARNRLIAALADVTVVVESDFKGGAMVTARIAADYNREVMALPGRVNDTYSRGCNRLIASNTAAMICEASDLIALLGWRTKPVQGTQTELSFDIPEHYGPVLALIREQPGITVNELCVALGMSYAGLSSLLFEMEINDFICSLPGGRYGLPAKMC